MLFDFDLKVGKGQKYIFSAPSGFGKSTVFNMIMGFIKPDNGRVIIDGLEINDDNVQDIRSKISYLPQKISLPNISVIEFIEQVTDFSQNRFSYNTFTKWVSEVDLPYDVLDGMLSSLSGGERQRLMLAVCIAMNKDILLIDEGLSGVDNIRAEKVLSLLAEDKELTIIYISHDKSHAAFSGFDILEVR